MRTSQLLTALSLSLLAAPLTGCSKHKCDLNSDGEKAALGTVADMTQGAHSCRVEGAFAVSGIVNPGMRCSIGSDNCVPTMETIHGDGATVKSVSKSYKTWLEHNAWAISDDKKSESKAANGKKLVGREIVAKNGDQGLIIRLFPFGPKLVQVRTMLVDKAKSAKSKQAHR
jgi:hypothetical protein